MRKPSQTQGIRLLSPDVANLIAAGEVVERPAAVVKELIENALDAGALNIEVTSHQAGFGELKVVDDGKGIPSHEAELALQRHATSKIYQAEDLQQIETYGFRGEALAAISSVSKIEMLTRLKSHSDGFLVQAEGGRILQTRQAGCAPGTSVAVRELFYNTPARRRFMKSDSTEESHIVTAVELAALANLDVSFKLTCNNREILFCPPSQTLETRLRDLYQKSTPKRLLEVYLEAGGVEIKGVLGSVAEHQGTRNYMRWFVNQRPVEHRGISHAVLQVYQPLLPKGKFPFAFIFVELPPQLVDVNVHPTKREVKFRDESAIHKIILNAVKTALEPSNPASWIPPTIKDLPTESPAPKTNQSLPFDVNAWNPSQVRESIATYFNSSLDENSSLEQNTSVPGHFLNILGLVGKKYFAGYDEEGFFIIDQHAAHERLIYEELLNNSGDIKKQLLLVPIQVELNAGEFNLLMGIKEILDKSGIDFTVAGKNVIMINSQPHFFNGDIYLVIKEILETGHENDKIDHKIQEKIFKAIACKSAVKAGERLHEVQIQTLIQRLKQHNIIQTCPHGRPYIFRISWSELDKIFKRNY
ncbi:MAG: DNA mismatch repair endonuclease MutL [candidate division FCPU426 bacterium]